MASIQGRGGSFRVMFRHRGRLHTATLGRVTEAEARAKAAQVDYLLMRLKQGLITLAGDDIVAFVLNDGAIPGPTPSRITLAVLRDRYLDTHGNGTLEPQTLRGIRRHFAHLTRHFGEAFAIASLTLADLQAYVDKRARAKWRGRLVGPATIRKEVVTLRTAWNWGTRMEIVAGPFPSKGLRYAKGDEKPPFQTRAEILRQLPGLSARKAAELWACLYLTLPEIEALLSHVKASALHPWIYPLVVTAAHTGARKGELLRMRVADVDFGARVVTIREKKRAHDRRTTRRVPLSSALGAILKSWLKVHPGGDPLFAQSEVVAGSRKRSLRTGYLSNDRPGGEKTRMAGVVERERPGILPITEEECHHHLKQSLKGSEWEVRRPRTPSGAQLYQRLCHEGDRSAHGAGVGRPHERGDATPLRSPLPERTGCGDEERLRVGGTHSWTACALSRFRKGA